MKTIANNTYSHIKGWGIDADPENDPTYPIKRHTEEDHQGYTWERPFQQQISHDEELHSIERPTMSSVFGTSSPLKGLSGKIRRFAFRYSENSYAHWLPLLLADRVNVIEGWLDDFKQGYFPNYFKEKGWKALWKFNPTLLLKKIAPVVILTSVGALCLFRKNGSLQKA